MSDEHNHPHEILDDLWMAGGHLVDAATDVAHSAVHAGAAALDFVGGDTTGADQMRDKAGDDLSNAGVAAHWAGSEVRDAWDHAADGVQTTWHDLNQ